MNPGAVDEVLNMGECWNEEGFKQYRRDIIETNKAVGKIFKRAYKYIAAAKLVSDDWSSCNGEALNINSLNLLKEDLKEKILKNHVGSLGNDRHLFATAFTPNGIVSYIDNLIEGYKNVYVLNGGPNTGKTSVLDYLSQEALKRGYYVEILHTPLLPEKIEHILIPELSTAVISSNEINQKFFEGQQIYMDRVLNGETLKKHEENINSAKADFYHLLNKGLDCIKEAKALHDKLETYYVPNMNFEKVDKVYDDVLSRILSYEEEYLNNK